MRYPVSEKLEIARIVEQLHLPARKTLDQLGTPRRTFYIVQDNKAAGLRVPHGVETVKRWPDAGGTGASVCTIGRDFATVQAHIDYLAEVKQRIDA